jgi:catabolite regulation protein CreA
VPKKSRWDATRFISQVLLALRGLHVHQLLGREAEHEVVGHRRHVVPAVGQDHAVVEGADLGELLGAAVQVAHVGHGLDDDLALDGQADAQHAVRGRVLGPEVDEELVGLEARHGGGVLGGDHGAAIHRTCP